MHASPRAAVAKLKSPIHGGLDYASLQKEGIPPEEVVDFSVNVNPFGPPPTVYEAMARAAATRYPDPYARALQEHLAIINGVEPGQVLVTNGAVQGIWLVALAFICSAQMALVLAPTFNEYQRASKLMGAQVRCYWSREKDAFRLNIEAIARWIKKRKPKMVWLCNPNNPTGGLYLKEEVQILLDACMAVGSLLVIDEAYVNFVERPWTSVNLLESGYLILIRSMTKDYALAGLRLGYVLAPVEIIKVLRKVQPPWSVNVVAQEAGLAALACQDYYCESWRKLRNLTKAFRHSLLELGCKPLDTETNFFLIHVGNGRYIQEQLWTNHILVRDCASFGLPAHIRVGTRLETENERLLSCLSSEKIRPFLAQLDPHTK